MSQRRRASQRRPSQYENAAAWDGINEMHPEQVRERVRRASLREQTESASFEFESSGDGVSSGSSSSELLPRVSSSSSSSFVKSERRTSRRLSLAPAKFADEEMVALRALFMLVDIDDDGFITASDLMTWVSPICLCFV